MYCYFLSFPVECRISSVWLFIYGVSHPFYQLERNFPWIQGKPWTYQRRKTRQRKYLIHNFWIWQSHKLCVWICQSWRCFLTLLKWDVMARRLPGSVNVAVAGADHTTWYPFSLPQLCRWPSVCVWAGLDASVSVWLHMFVFWKLKKFFSPRVHIMEGRCP